MTTQAAEFFLHTPAQSTSNYVQWAEWLQTAPKIDYGCILDRFVIPLHPGDLMAVLARPGHGKSSFMAYMAKRTAQKIVERGDTRKCVVYVSWEQSVEEIEAFFQSGQGYTSTDLAWGRVPLEKVKEQSIKRIHLPIWMIGYSMKDADKQKPPMTVQMVYDTIRAIRYDYGYEPILACFDYIQKIPVTGKRNRTEEVTEAIFEAKRLAQDIAVPIMAGVQASRETDHHSIQVPMMGDAQWASSIEQEVDKELSLFRPIKVLKAGEFIEIGEREYKVDENLLVIKLLKQRFDNGSGVWAVRFEPQTLTVSDYTVTKLD